MWQDSFNTILSLGTILIQIGLVIGIFSYLFAPEGKLIVFLKKHGFLFGFLLALAGISMSLFYSEVIGYAPCELCWYLRIFLYPLAVIFGAELIHKEKGHALWLSAIVLSGFGLLLSTYQYIATEFFPGSLACAAQAVSCAKIYFTSFGYITIPMMALTSFAAIIFLTLISRPDAK